MSRLHIFDMDGTLLRGAASVELSRYLGCFAEADAVERAWLRGEIGDVRFWELVLPLWSDITDDQIDEAFDRAPWIDGVREVFADITARGEHSVVISQSPEFFVRRLVQWGAGAAYGAGVQPGGRADAGLLLTVQDKVTIATAVMTKLGLTTCDCVAYGDSTSDELLFRRLPHTVAVNAKPPLRALAAVEYRGDDLRGAYRAGRALVDAAV
jgi:phosphoserine phosphatase